MPDQSAVFFSCRSYFVTALVGKKNKTLHGHWTEQSKEQMITDSLSLKFYILAFNVISCLFSDASPVGGNRCHFGPALWCQSRVHAKVKK